MIDSSFTFAAPISEHAISIVRTVGDVTCTINIGYDGVVTLENCNPNEAALLFFDGLKHVFEQGCPICREREA